MIDGKYMIRIFSIYEWNNLTGKYNGKYNMFSFIYSTGWFSGILQDSIVTAGVQGKSVDAD